MPLFTVLVKECHIILLVAIDGGKKFFKPSTRVRSIGGCTYIGVCHRPILYKSDGRFEDDREEANNQFPAFCACSLFTLVVTVHFPPNTLFSCQILLRRFSYIDGVNHVCIVVRSIFVKWGMTSAEMT